MLFGGGLVFASSVERYYPLVLGAGDDRLYCFAVPKEFVIPSNVQIQVQYPNLRQEDVQATLWSGDDSIVARPFYGAFLRRRRNGRVDSMVALSLWNGGVDVPAVDFGSTRCAIHLFLKNAQPFFASLDKKVSISNTTGCDKTGRDRT